MNCWLLCLPREDLEHCMKIGTFGLSRKHLLGSVRKGDKVVFCAGKGDWKIIGFGTATSEYYFDDKRIFLKDGIFPDRFDISSEKLSPGGEIDLMSFVDRLELVTNLAYWAVYFRNGIARLSDADWQLVKSANDRATSSNS